MNHRLLWIGLPAAALTLAFSASGCGSYDSPDTTGGTTGSGGDLVGAGGTVSAGGSTASGGAEMGSGGIPEPPEASCDNVTPCGGEAVGVWFAQKSCLSVAGVVDLVAAGAGCPEAAITSGTIEVTGNFTLNEDLTISDNSNTISEIVFELEPKCLDISGTVSRCPNIGLVLTGIGFDDVTCVDSTTTLDGCTCTGIANQQGGMGYMMGFNAETSGNYTIADNTITASGTGSEDLAYSYCIDGPFMIATPTSVTDAGTIEGTIVLQKQQE